MSIILRVVFLLFLMKISNLDYVPVFDVFTFCSLLQVEAKIETFVFLNCFTIFPFGNDFICRFAMPLTFFLSYVVGA